jgi:hypothetical protein
VGFGLSDDQPLGGVHGDPRGPGELPDPDGSGFHDEVADGMYIVQEPQRRPPVVVNHFPPLLLVRLKVMDLPPEGRNREELYRTLLELNATDVVHGAYGIEEGDLILSRHLPAGDPGFPGAAGRPGEHPDGGVQPHGRIKTLAAAGWRADPMSIFQKLSTLFRSRTSTISSPGPRTRRRC